MDLTLVELQQEVTNPFEQISDSDENDDDVVQLRQTSQHDDDDSSSPSKKCLLARQCLSIELPWLLPCAENRNTDSSAAALPFQASALAVAAKFKDTSDTPTLHVAPRVGTFTAPLLPNASNSPFTGPTMSYVVTACNDALLKVSRRVIRRTLARRRARSEDAGESETKTETTTTTGVECLGMITRRFSMARPIDFVYAPQPLTSESIDPLQFEARCDTLPQAVVPESDLFAPNWFASPRFPATFPCPIEANPNMIMQHQDIPDDVIRSDTTMTLRCPVQRSKVVNSVDLPTSAALPPKQTEYQLAYIAAYRSGVEIAAVKACLARKPIWSLPALKAAISGSDIVENHSAASRARSFASSNAIHALTYSIVRGPFNRLRIAFGCDPTTDAAAYAVYQRITVRILKRTPLGVALRDAHRAPDVSRHVSEALDQHAAEYGDSPVIRGILYRWVAENAKLSTSFLIEDFLDDPTFAAIAKKPIDLYDPQRLGYYSEDSLTAMSQRILALLSHTVLIWLPPLLANSISTTAGELPPDTNAALDGDDSDEEHEECEDEDEEDYMGGLDELDEDDWRS